MFLVGKLPAVTPQDVVNVISFSANSMKFAAEIEAKHESIGGAMRLASRSCLVRAFPGRTCGSSVRHRRASRRGFISAGKGFQGKGALIICERSQGQTVQELGAYHGSLSRFESVDLLQAFAEKLNAVTGKGLGLIVRPREWQGVRQWTVHAAKVA